LQDPELNKSKFHKIGNTGYAAIYSSEVGKNPTKIEFRPRYEVGASLIAGLTNGSYLAYVTGGITYTGYELTLTPTAGTAPIGYRDLNTESSGSVAIGADDKANTATVTVSTDVIAKDSFAFTADGASTTTVAEQKLKKAVFGARAGVGVLFMLSPHIGPFVECTVGFKRKVDLGASTSYTDCKLEHDLSMFGANHYVNTYDLRVLLGVKVLLF
jgi:hypothetical protein